MIRRALLVWTAGALVVLPACGGDGGDDTAACGPTEQVLEAPSVHVPMGTPVTFDHHPPSSGPHPAEWPVPGVFTVPLSEPEQVAGLELGVVVISYAPDLPADQVAELQALSADYPDDLIVTPAAAPIDGSRSVVATAWEHRQMCDEVDLVVIRGFLRTWAGVAPDLP